MVKFRDTNISSEYKVSKIGQIFTKTRFNVRFLKLYFTVIIDRNVQFYFIDLAKKELSFKVYNFHLRFFGMYTTGNHQQVRLFI